MFDSVGWGEVMVVLVLALFVFGPERLPGIAAEAGKTLRKVRIYVKSMTEDLKSELGPELGNVDLASLSPRTFVQKHLFSDDDDDLDPAIGRPVSRAGAPLGVGEPAPWDPDTT
ncbi:MAG: Sec-independent protein translocase subunit TatB [Frankiales bacterium]|nr:Sec-independent protein translocase subunit TatB [Frankiales bacterium]